MVDWFVHWVHSLTPAGIDCGGIPGAPHFSGIDLLFKMAAAVFPALCQSTMISVHKLHLLHFSNITI